MQKPRTCSVRKLLRAVGVEEVSGQIEDALASPVHLDAVFVGHLGDRSRLQVFLVGVFDEFCFFVSVYNDRHSLLGFGDRQLCAVETFVFLRHQIQVDFQTVSQLADGYGNAAGTEVIAALDQCGNFFAAEHSLDVSLHRRISLLDFRAALEDGFLCMLFGRTCRSAAAVASGSAADQDDHIALFRTLSDHVVCRCCADYRADLHSLGNVIFVIYFVYQPCRQPDLVAVGAVAVGRFLS